MAKKIEPNLRKIGEYLRLEEKSVFIIPEYQRAYSWEIKHCDKLWQDLEAFIDSGGADPYFFGTIIINCQQDDTKLSLIDGQQRTTTFILLLKALLIRLNQVIKDTKKDEHSERLTRTLSMKRDRVIQILYKAKDEDVVDILQDFTHAQTSTVLENFSINEQYKKELSNIINSPDFQEAEKIAEKLKHKKYDNKYSNYFRNFKYFHAKLNDLSASRINVFAENILEKTEVIEIRSWNVDQAITMFNSLNSDGMPLKDADIISAKLYSNSGDNERKSFNENWETLKRLITELEQKRIVDLDAVLMQYMYIKRAQDKAYITDSDSVNVTTPGLRRYYTEENKSVLENPLELTAQLLKIAKIWDTISEYSVVRLSHKFNENIKLYLASYLSRYQADQINEAIVENFLLHLLKLFAVLELVETGYSSKNFKSFLFGLNILLVDPEVDIETIKEKIDDHIKKNWTPGEITEQVLEYSKNPLVFLDECIACINFKRSFQLPEKHDIEHIMPRSGQNITQIQKDAGLTDNVEFATLVNQLGNKIVLEDSINRSIGNAWFRTKIESSINSKTGYRDSQFLFPSLLVSKYKSMTDPLWTKDDITNRTLEVSKRISEFIFSDSEN